MLQLHVISPKFVNLSSSTIYLFVSTEKSTTLSGPKPAGCPSPALGAAPQVEPSPAGRLLAELRPQALPRAVGRQRRSLARRRPRPFPWSGAPPPREQTAAAASPVPTFSFSGRSRSRAPNTPGSELPVAATTELEQRRAILCCGS
jgi:hypothetical protein